ncbi:AfsR/SARP family transcriptional regulator [Stackebrandtia albiflava]|uniref:AfsR/SARP family transcriptional regulator n=1 Tax=Stackebrandtia albiflava TaxID=406432 RepID=UPI0013153AC9|nr:BTAD domain-containing putative transcriptional regulator [Stackebrandtia albiflava]
MDFRILGPLEVSDDSGPVRIPGRHQPRLLAALLLEAGKVVPLHRLVDTLWDDHPPATARRQVQNAMASLRRVVTSGIETVGDGYRLTTDRLDATTFVRWVREAAEAASRDDHALAHALLCRALDLWRGPALAGLPGRLLASAAARWDERRLEAHENRMETELALGQPGRVIGEARELLDAQPNRQRLCGLLMLALHRSGRTSEALALYGSLRRRLADDLGIDPGRAIRDVHRAILRDDASPPGPRAPATSSVPIPAQLPNTADFTGRAEELATLDALADDTATGTVVTVISGTGGVGKTALALRWAHRRADRFPDGQLFVDLRGYDDAEPLTPSEVLHRFLRALGHPADAVPAELDEASALFRSTLHGRRVLVVLDNARTVAQVRPLLPAGPGSLALVTSRDRLTGLVALDGARPLGVDVWSPGESRRLLTELVGADRVDREPAAADRIVALCGGLPLAIRIVGATITTRPRHRLAEIAAELEDGDRLDRLAIPGDPRATVADGIRLSVRTLEPATRRCLHLLATVPTEDFPDSLAVAVTGLPEADARRHIGLLTAAHLLERPRDGRLRFHDLVRLYARREGETLLSRRESEAAVTRLLDWWHDCEDITEYDDRAATVTAFAAHPGVWRAARPLAANVHEGRDPRRIRALARLGLAAAETASDLHGQAVMHNLVAGTYWVSQRMDEATAAGELALRAARSSGDPVLTARQLATMGVFTQLTGDQADSKTYLLEALRLCERHGDPADIAARLAPLGSVCVALGDYDEAEEYLTRALEATTDDRVTEDVVNQLAVLCLDRGRYREGLRWVDRALRDPDAPRRYMSLQIRVRLSLAMGRAEAAHADLKTVLDERYDAHPQQSGRRELLAAYHLLTGELDLALHHATEFLRGAGRTTSVFHDAHAELVSAIVRDARREHPAAIRHARAAERAFRRMSGPLRRGRALAVLASAHAGLGEYDVAAGYRGRAAEIFARLGVTGTERLPEITRVPDRVTGR